MGEGNWFRRGGRRASGGKQQSKGAAKRKSWLSDSANRCALSFESLEERCLLTTFLVSNTLDLVDGVTALGSLRWAITQANANPDADEIVFSQALFDLAPSFPRTISLNGGELTIAQEVRILGPGARKLSVSQTTPESRVFNLAIGSDIQVRSVEISGLTISGGRIVGDGMEDKGGGIYNREDLTMTEVIINNNRASMGGGGVYTAFGNLTLDRSLVTNNFGGGDGGGGILNGRVEITNLPTTTITNSTFSGNSAGKWGGAILNRNGTLNLEHSTVTQNTAASGLGEGVASHGNAPGPVPTNPPTVPTPPHPDPTVFTFVTHTIVFGNGASDFDRVGTVDTPPRRTNPSVTSGGFNIIGTGNTTVPEMDPPIPPPTTPPDDQAFTAANNDLVATDPLFAIDALGNPLGLRDFGGSTNVFLLRPTSPALDGGDPALLGGFEQRGRHFTRVFGAAIDIGAAEVQSGVFIVDTLVDETDLVFTEIYTLELVAGEPDFTFNPLGYEGPGDFSLREAIDFAAKNPGADVVQFSPALNSVAILEDEDDNDSPAPTILLNPTLGALNITRDLDLQGPAGFILEIDAVGADVDPDTQNGTGARVFNIDNGSASTFIQVSISNLTIMGADIIGQGGGIFTREDLNLSQVTLKDNNATDDGGALFVTGGAFVNINGSTFSNNRAGDNGAAIYVTGATTTGVISEVTLLNSTISSNEAGNRGGGIYADGARAIIEYSTLTLNDANSTLGSGIGAQGALADVDVRSTIISGNVSNDVSFFTGAALATFDSFGYNFIGNGNARNAFNQPGDQINQLNPMLEPLSNTGGLVETHRPVYLPLSGQVSPVIDAGDPAAPFAPTLDGRGVAEFIRIVDVPGVTRSGKGPIDIGAYEVQGTVFVVSSLADDNDGVITPGSLTLREAIALANANPFDDIIRFDPFLLSFNNPTIFLGGDTLAPGTPADIRITSSMIIEWQSGDPMASGAPLVIDGFNLDNPSETIIGSRMFTVDDGNGANQLNVIFRSDSPGNDGFRFRNARSSQGGGVFYSRENLTFSDTTFINNLTFDPDETEEFPPSPAVDQTGLHGGALYQEGTGQAVKPTLTLERVLLTGNSTNDVNADGGAIYVLDAALVIDDTTVAGNSTTMINSDGGGIALKNATFTAQNFSTITGNIIQAGSSDGGGLYFSDASVVTLNDAVVSGNETTGVNSEGGGIAGVNSQLNVNRSVISENSTFGSQSSGGGIALTGGVAVIDATSVRANVVVGSNSNGGGIWNNGGVLTVRGSTIADNQATHTQSKGGGVYSDTNLAGTQSTLILNSTISGNSAPRRGGGVFNADGRTDIKHSTITNNSSLTANKGSGVASFGNAATTLTTVLSSIIAENVGAAAGTGTDVDSVDGSSTNTFQSLGYNIIGTGNSSTIFNLSTDDDGILNPGLEPLADNGAPTNVVFELLTHALTSSSLAINAGNPSFDPSGFIPSLSSDQRGTLRVQGGLIDIGAYESDFSVQVLADFDSDNDVDGSDFLTWQRNLGRTNATRAQGDADGNQVVNGLDLTAWRDNFGAISIAPTAGASGEALFAAAVQSAPAQSDQLSPLPTDDFTSLASLGGPESKAQPAASAGSNRSQESADFAAFDNPVAAALAWNATSGYSILDGGEDFESLLAEIDGGSDGAAEDAVFAAWGDELLF